MIINGVKPSFCGFIRYRGQEVINTDNIVKAEEDYSLGEFSVELKMTTGDTLILRECPIYTFINGLNESLKKPDEVIEFS